LRRDLADHRGSWKLSRDVSNIHSDLDPCRCGAARATVGLIQFGKKFNVSNTTLQLLGDHVLARHPARPAAPRNALELLRITSLNWLTNSSVELIELEKMTGLRSHASLAGVANLNTLRRNHRYRHSLTAAI
jgi:hypothetical protein